MSYTENDKKLILRAYRGLLRVSKNVRKTKGHTDEIRRAFEIAVDAHKDMRRKSGEPYILHPIAVARICAEEMGLGATSIVCALLHDTVEDTDITIEDINKRFGPAEAKIINGLTKISGVFDFKTSGQAENFRKMILTLPDDIRVIFIKLADRLHNMRTLDSMRRDKQLKIASETLFLYAPLAHRLGLYNIKTELEDLSLKFKSPSMYEEIENKLEKTKDVRNRFIKRFINPVSDALQKEGLNFEIKGRTKSIYSIWNKIKNKNVEFEEIYDIFAIRIILDSKKEEEKADCWKVYSIVTDFYKPNPDRLRDWITTPKGNGYESLHSTVMSPTGKWVEVQIRTKRMDEIAEKGLAAHWKYKENTESSKESQFEKWIGRIRDFVENTEGGDTQEFLDDFKSSLISDEIYIFTPKGELKILPAGATTLDFAFDIHTEVGKKCIGAKVNHKLVPLSHVLNNGDQVEILTSTKQKPKEDWLDFVVTSKARTRIKASLKDEQREIGEAGKEILQRKLKSLKVDFTEKNITELVRLYNLKDPLDLFYLISLDKLDLSKIKDIVQKGGELKLEREKQPQLEQLDEIVDKFGGKNTGAIILGGDSDLSGIKYSFAKCCSPIPGDDVFGFITINEGIKIHQTSCPNAVQLYSNYAYRIINARWEGQKVIEYLAKIQFTGIDSFGLVHELTNVISKNLNINMKAISIESKDGIFEGKIEVMIHNNDHLNQLIDNMKKIDGIKTVTRTL